MLLKGVTGYLMLLLRQVAKKQNVNRFSGLEGVSMDTKFPQRRHSLKKMTVLGAAGTLMAAGLKFVQR